MMIGSYPCCDAALMIEMPERTPTYWRELCPACGAAVWHLFSRVEPQSWTEAEFLKEHEVIEATKQVRERNPAPDLLSRLTDEQRAEFLRMETNLVLYGDTRGADPTREVPRGILETKPND